MTRQQQRILSAFDVAPVYGGMSGLGVTTQQITSTIGGSIMAVAGPIAAINPIAGGIVAGVGALTSLIGGLFHPDLTKVQATAIVDQIEAQHLRPNLARWQSAPASAKTVSAQRAALEVVDQSLAAVQQGCSNPALGTAGQNCISERLVKGGTAPWCPTGTDCDWITLYRDPIANDPNVIPDPSPVDGLTDTVSSFFGSSTGSSGGGIPTPLLIGAALLIGGLLWD